MSKLFNKGFVMIMIMNFLLFLSFNMFNTTLPLYFQELGVSESLTGICISIYTLGSLLTRPISGRALDEYGRKAIFFISMTLLIMFVFSYSFVQTLAFILVLRLLHGIDWSFATTATSTMATDSIPKQMLGTGMGLYGLSMALSLAVGPLIGVTIIDHFSFAVMFRVATVSLLLVLALAFVFPFAPIKRNPIQKSNKSNGSFIERSAVAPALMMGCVTLTMASVSTYVPLYAQELGVGNIGYFFSIYAVGLLLSRFFIGKIIDSYGFRMATLPCLLSMMGAMLLLTTTSSATTLLVSGFFYGLGYGGAQTAFQSMSVINAPQSRFGAANGTFFIGFDLGIGAGALVAGFLSEALGFATMYLLLSSFIVLAIVLLLRFAPRKTN